MTTTTAIHCVSRTRPFRQIDGHAPLVLPDSAEGEPQKLVHKIESGHLDPLPGKKRTYAAWQELFEALKQMLSSLPRYCYANTRRNNLIFYVSLVTVERLTCCGALEKISSAPETWWHCLKQLGPRNKSNAFAARDAVDEITAAAFRKLGTVCETVGRTNSKCSNGFWKLSAGELNHCLTCPLSPSTPTAATRITTRQATTPLQFARAIRFARHLGEEKHSRFRLLRHHLVGFIGKKAIRSHAGTIRSGSRGAQCWCEVVQEQSPEAR